MIYPAAIKHLSLLLATSSCFMTNNLVESAPCGRWYSSSCLAESDKRYDTSYTNNIREQDSLWADQEGFWLATSKSYDSNDQPNQPMTFDPTNLATGFGLPYTRDTSTTYVNITLSGSRYFEHRYKVYSPAPQEFCDKPVIFPAMNALSNGICGINGYASWIDSYATTGYEKDGSLQKVGTSVSFSQDRGFNRGIGIGTSIGDDTVFVSSSGTNQGGAGTISKVWTFTNKEKTKAEEQSTTFNTIGDESTLIGYTKYKYVQISKSQFSSGIEEVWESNKVQEENRGALPMGECLGVGGCPTEEDWCVTDPNCSKSPYQEPEGVARAEVIAGFTVAGAVLVIAALYMLHLRVVKNQKEEIRQTLIKGIAGGANVGFTQAGLTMDNLVVEFKKIDTSGDGFVQKSELRAFTQSGMFGEMSEKDFDRMFKTIDTNASGEIDFIEFVTFIGQCPAKKDSTDRYFADNEA